MFLNAPKLQLLDVLFLVIEDVLPEGVSFQDLHVGSEADHKAPCTFHWADVDENWQDWQPAEYIESLTHPIAEKGFKADLDAMLWADVCVLVLPCGRSAHTEAGWFAGKGLKTIVYMPEKQEPELMYKLFDGVVGDKKVLMQRSCHDR